MAEERSKNSTERPAKTSPKKAAYSNTFPAHFGEFRLWKERFIQRAYSSVTVGSANGNHKRDFGRALVYH